jgi:hypothetical protein
VASKSELRTNTAQNGAALDKHAVRQSLQELRGFKENWDGYGAAPLDPQNLDAALRFIDSLPDDAALTPMVVPMTRGRVQLEWHRGNRLLELEFETPTTIHYLQWDSDQGIETEDIISADEVDALKGLLTWFRYTPTTWPTPMCISSAIKT